MKRSILGLIYNRGIVLTIAIASRKSMLTFLADSDLEAATPSTSTDVESLS